MLTYGALEPAAIAARLRSGTGLATGPFRFLLRSAEPAVARGLKLLYADFAALPAEGAFDFHVRVDRPAGVRRWLRPQVVFYADEWPAFKPLPAPQSFALLEWGMNWCIAAHAHHLLLFHAAVVERNGCAVVLPGLPGAGKSTLTAALAMEGWRLLSDEMMVVDPADLQLQALARPVSLKNASIEIIRRRHAAAVIGDVATDTHKGTVAHLRPPAASVAAAAQRARCRHIVFPRWRADAATSLAPSGKAAAFLAIAGHAFNYSFHGRRGFDALHRLVAAADCWDFEYADLDDALRVFEGLAA